MIKKEKNKRKKEKKKGEWREVFREDPTKVLDHTNFIFIQSDENVHIWLLLNRPNEDPHQVLVYCHLPSTKA